MKIVHNITLLVGESEQTAFSEIGIPLSIGFSSFKIEEGDQRWPAVPRLISLFKAVDTTTTKFSSQEISGAKYLGVVSEWHHGYPEPVDGFGYLKKTFDQHGFCMECGAGLAQNAPFRIKKPPAWGVKSILQLNWVFDEYFVRPDVWDSVFRPYGVGCSPVVLDETGVEAESIVQLNISGESELKIDGGMTGEKCLACGVVKYPPIARGFYTPPIAPVNSEIFKSSQYFGSGRRAYRAVIVSASLYGAIKAAGIKGAVFKPCATLDKEK